MNASYINPLMAVVVLFLLAYAGVAAGLEVLFGVIIPYLAVITFIVGFIMKIMNWAKSAVPFRIPTTCGQGFSMPWIKQNKIDNPNTTGGVIIRMALEILLFRSLFRNFKSDMKEGNKLTYMWEIFLWVGALVFHYSFLVVLIRHLRFFMEPVPYAVKFLEILDGFFQVGLPGLCLSGVALAAAVVYLFLRRIVIPQVRYISLAQDYFPLFLIFSIAFSGILMRYFSKVDIVSVKALTMGLVTFRPVVPEGVGSVFYVHIFLVSVLFAYFPFSKLMHLGGIFLSPTRNMANNNRAKRHVNPWNYPVKTHTYDEYEEEFREKMIEAGLPVVKKE